MGATCTPDGATCTPMGAGATDTPDGARGIQTGATGIPVGAGATGIQAGATERRPVGCMGETPAGGVKLGVRLGVRDGERDLTLGVRETHVFRLMRTTASVNACNSTPSTSGALTSLCTGTGTCTEWVTRITDLGLLEFDYRDFS